MKKIALIMALVASFGFCDNGKDDNLEKALRQAPIYVVAPILSIYTQFQMQELQEAYLQYLKRQQNTQEKAKTSKGNLK